MQIDELPGVEPHQAQSLRVAGIRNCQQLLQAARHPDGLTGLARTTRLPVDALNALVDRAELSQLEGVGPANLAHLVAAGILCLSALVAQEPDLLRLRLGEVTPRPPNLAVVEYWIAQARRRMERKSGQEVPPAPTPRPD